MKAVGLLSGGLDSQLSIRLILAQGVEVSAVHFRTVFCNCTPRGCAKSTARTAAEEMGIPFEEIDNTKEFLPVIKAPLHGYGSGMNPCIDCKILMFRRAGEYMKRAGASFIITGEVLGQRPMSQHRQALMIIEKESGLAGLIVRPLSAHLLPPSIPEEKGWINRAGMLGLSGRTRKPQMVLAEKFSMKDYPCAAGGCLLTDKSFSRRIKESFGHKEDMLRDVQLLKVGRHFRMAGKIKLIIGRNELENKRIRNLASTGDILIEPVDVPGPFSLVKRNSCDNIKNYLKEAVILCAGYCDGSGNVKLRYGEKKEQGIEWFGTLEVERPERRGETGDNCRRI